MHMILRAGVALLVFGAVPSAVGAAPKTPSAEPTAHSADARLKALYDAYAAWTDKEFGAFQNKRGEQERAGYLPHVNEATQLRRAAHLKDVLAQLNSIPAAQLSSEEQVNASVLRTVLEADIADYQFRTWEMPFNSDSSFWTYLDAQQPFDDADGYRRYIARLRDIPRFFDEQIVNMRAGLARGFSVPKATLNGRDKT